MRVDIHATVEAAALEVLRTGKHIDWSRVSKRIYEVSKEKVSADTLRKEFLKVSDVQSSLGGITTIEPVMQTPTKTVVLEISVLGRGSVGHLFEIAASSEYEEAKSLANKLAMYCKHMDEEWRNLNCFAVALSIIKQEPVAKSSDDILTVKLL